MGLKASLHRTTYMEIGVFTEGGFFLDLKVCCHFFGFAFHSHWVLMMLPGAVLRFPFSQTYEVGVVIPIYKVETTTQGCEVTCPRTHVLEIAQARCTSTLCSSKDLTNVAESPSWSQGER